MKDAAQPMGKRVQLGQGVLERVALVDDAIKPQFGGHLEVLSKQLGLFALDRFVIGGREAGLAAGQAIVIEPGFAQGHNLGMARQFAQGRPPILRRLGSIGRVPAHDRGDVRELLCQFDGPPAGGQAGSNANELGDACGTGAFHDLRQVGGESPVAQVRMGVIKHRRHL